MCRIDASKYVVQCDTETNNDEYVGDDRERYKAFQVPEHAHENQRNPKSENVIPDVDTRFEVKFSNLKKKEYLVSECLEVVLARYQVLTLIYLVDGLRHKNNIDRVAKYEAEQQFCRYKDAVDGKH